MHADTKRLRLRFLVCEGANVKFVLDVTLHCSLRNKAGVVILVLVFCSGRHECFLHGFLAVTKGSGIIRGIAILGLEWDCLLH